MMLNAADLVAFRADIGRLLPDTCAILQPAYTPDGAGGGSVVFTAVGTVACRVDPLPTKDRLELVALSEKMQIEYKLTLPYGTAIDVHYRVSTAGNTYDVVMLAKEHSWAVSVRAYIARVK